MYPYQSEFELGPVRLNVAGLDRMSRFYQEHLGMDLLASDEKSRTLGVPSRPLVILNQAEDQVETQASNGIYHFAILLPSRAALGNVLRHFIRMQTPLIGASDHGYSEALYLEDPEGNGIEIYRDKDQSEWTIYEDGTIKAITIEMDANGVFAAADKPDQVLKLEKDSVMGHFHLSVTDTQKAQEIYGQALNMKDKTPMPTATFLASGSYHHHVAANRWSGSHLLKRKPGQVGLESISFIYQDHALYQAALDRFAAISDFKSVTQEDQVNEFVDGFGIKIRLEIK
ncbi:VOC family protein [Eremococcus coleocola]|uniref:VOC family protein n=1 Tax=Eremococcus coleocola TaxID=88132 RepID=UPI00041CAB26|nr:VOC family protein [Eremococcus coleocola]